MEEEIRRRRDFAGISSFRDLLLDAPTEDDPTEQLGLSLRRKTAYGIEAARY